MLRFSTTQTWNPSFYKYIHNVQSSILGQLYLPPPPDNSSDKTRQELCELLHKQDNRTTDQIMDILRQRTFDHMIKDYGITEEDLQLCILWDNMISPYIFHFKNHFDRVRPSFLEKKLIPCIEVPNHPAYPSGHSTQNYFFALILGDKYPERRSEFLKVAEQVAINREYAGVHYHTDTVAGHSLAYQLYKIYKDNHVDGDIVKLLTKLKI